MQSGYATASSAVRRPAPKRACLVNHRPLRGCIPILCTPFTEDNEADLDSLAREVEWVISEGATAVAALAIASEGYKLTEPERDAVTRQVVATVAGRGPAAQEACLDVLRAFARYLEASPGGGAGGNELEMPW